MLTQTDHDVFSPIKEELCYWLDPGTGDRSKDDRDCILAGGDLRADTIFSLWLPLRYTLNKMSKPRWRAYLELEYAVLRPRRLRLKNCTDFLTEMIDNPEDFIDLENPLTEKLSNLMTLGMTRANVMILPHRSWNTWRGGAPFYDYIPHFLEALFMRENHGTLVAWLKREHLEPLFYEGEIARDNIKDLANTGSPRSHSPQDINLTTLFDNYICVLRERGFLLEHSKESTAVQ